MADVTNTGDDDMPQIYNVSFGVGPDIGGFYRRDDIMLVQYLLKKVWQEHGNDFEQPLPPPPEPGSINVDGYYGPITARWIRRYQEEAAKAGISQLVDGRVDRAHGKLSSISQTVYMIWHLNHDFRKVEPASFSDLSSDPECPPELVGAIVANTPPDVVSGGQGSGSGG
jgi:hypothetical protein